MRRPGTWLVVGALLLVAAAAAADTVRETLRSDESPAATTEAATTTQEAPAGLDGTIYYTDEQCRLRTLQLPELRQTDPPEWNECGLSVSPDGRRVAEHSFVWHPGGSVKASQSAGSVVVVLDEGTSESSYTFFGSSPAFNGEGLLTFALGAEIRAMNAGCPLSRAEGPLVEPRAIRACSRVVVPREAVLRAARQHPNAPDAPDYPVSVVVREASWLGADRLALLLALRIRGVGEEFDLIALFERGGIVEVVAVFERLASLRTSPRGGYFGVLTEARARVLLFDSEGRALTVPPLSEARAFDWSPDERWIAIATPGDVYLVQLSRAPRVRRLGIVARDLAWRAVFVS